MAAPFDLRVVDKLPALPAVLLDLMNSLQKEGTSLTELAAKIGNDIPLSLRVLKVVNSPFYGLSRQIGSLTEAVMVLGAGTVKSLVTAALFAGRLPLEPCGSFDPTHVWEHGLYCALSARRLAARVGEDRDLAFTAGLLHDVGEIVLYNRNAADFVAVRDSMAAHGGSFLAAERDHFGVDHAEVGARIMARWRLPGLIERAVAGHHAPPDGAERLVDLIYVADALRRGLEATGHQHAEDLEPAPSFLRLGLTRTECCELLAAVPEEFAALRSLLGGV